MARSKEFDTDEVLKKAIDLFWDKGYNGCSMQDIVEELGLSRSSIYETFGDKRTLFIEALKKYEREGLDALSSRLDSAPDVWKAFQQILRSNLPGNPDSCALKGCFMVNSAMELATHDPEIASIVKENQVEVERVFLKAVERGQRAGQINNELPPRAIARFLRTSSSGVRVASRSGDDEQTLGDIITVTLAAIAPRPLRH